MSDHDSAPDPMDKAYVQAEALLGDQEARAARRARVLAAVAQAEAAPAPSRPPRSRAGWLVAASVAGLSLFLATQVYWPLSIDRSPPPPPAAPSGVGAGPPPPAVAAPSAASRSPPPSPAPPSAAKPGAPASPVVQGMTAPSPPPAPAPAPPPAVSPHQEAAAAAAPQALRPYDDLSDANVTASRAKSSPREARSERSVSATAGLAARLRDAAALGRAQDVAKLLARGAPADEPDEDGETALMKSVQGHHPAIAAMLLSHGASLDRENRSGVSARDMATAIGDAELNRALALDR